MGSPISNRWKWGFHWASRHSIWCGAYPWRRRCIFGSERLITLQNCLVWVGCRCSAASSESLLKKVRSSLRSSWVARRPNSRNSCSTTAICLSWSPRSCLKGVISLDVVPVQAWKHRDSTVLRCSLVRSARWARVALLWHTTCHVSWEIVLFRGRLGGWSASEANACCRPCWRRSACVCTSVVQSICRLEGSGKRLGSKVAIVSSGILRALWRGFLRATVRVVVQVAAATQWSVFRMERSMPSSTHVRQPCRSQEIGSPT